MPLKADCSINTVFKAQNLCFNKGSGCFCVSLPFLLPLAFVPLFHSAFVRLQLFFGGFFKRFLVSSGLKELLLRCRFGRVLKSHARQKTETASFIFNNLAFWVMIFLRTNSLLASFCFTVEISIFWFSFLSGQ